MLTYQRDGNTFTVPFTDPAAADHFEAMVVQWTAPESTTDHGDLTAYNAQQAALRAARDAVQDEIDALDIHHNPAAGLQQQMDALIQKRERINDLLRATARPEPEGEG